MLKRTPLYATHQRLGARLVEFGGWEMPVLYGGIVAEHLAVRQAAGLFDISHMGEVEVTGPGAAAFLNHVLTNDLARLSVGQAQYTLMCNERGGVVDDLYAYRLDAQHYLLILNASRIEADWDWLQAQVDKAPTRDGFQLRNVSQSYGALALQGPKSRQFVSAALPGGSIGGRLVGQASDLNKNEAAQFVVDGTTVWIASTGYTGEDGFEVIAPSEALEMLWNRIITAGAPFGVKPAGLGARDSLRLESCYPLYGHELDEETTPIEAGLGGFVSLTKGEFIGRGVLARQKTDGTARRSVAFRMSDRSAPPRQHYAIWSHEPQPARIGEVTSGTQGPTLGVGIGMGYVAAAHAAAETAIQIEVRGRLAAARIVKKPLYRRPQNTT